MNVNIKGQKKRFEDSVFFRTNDFMLLFSDGETKLDECVIAAVSYDDKEIHVTVRDQYTSGITERWLDSLMKRKCRFFGKRKRLNVSLSKINPSHTESVYTIVFNNCRLKGYRSSQYAYNSATIHFYDVTLRYDGREYIHDKPSIMDDIEKIKESIRSQEADKALAILDNSNSMLDEAKNTAIKRLSTDTAGTSDRIVKVCDAIDKAKRENVEVMDRIKRNKTKKSN